MIERQGGSGVGNLSIFAKKKRMRSGTRHRMCGPRSAGKERTDV